MSSPHLKALADAMHQALFSSGHPDHVLRAGEALAALLEEQPLAYASELANLRSSLASYREFIEYRVRAARGR